MKTSFKTVYAVLSATLTLLIATLRIFMTKSFTDPEGVYAHGSSLPLVFDIVVFVVALLLTVLPFFTKDRFCYTSLTKPTAFTGALLGFVFIVVSVMSLLDVSSMDKGQTVKTVMAVAGILSGIGLIMNVFVPNKYYTIRAALSFAPIIYSLAGLIEVYFDMSILITSPNRVYSQTTFLAMAFFFLSSSRVLLGMTDHRFLYIGASVTSLLTAACALPNLILGDALAKGTSDKPGQFVLMLAVAVFSLSKLLTTAFKKS